MKRFIISYILIFAVLATAFSATSATVVAELDTGADISTYDIGFADARLDSYSNSPSYASEPFPLELSLLDNGELHGSTRVEGVDGLFVYWKLLSYDIIDLTLSMSGPLNNGSANMQWTVTWEYKAEVNSEPVAQKLDSSNSTLGPLAVAHCVPPDVFKGAFGCIPLLVQTGKLQGMNIDNPYTGQLTLGITIR